MDGGIYSDTTDEFFKSSEKSILTGTATSGLGFADFSVYQENSVDLSTLLETYNDTSLPGQQPPLPVAGYSDSTSPSRLQFCGVGFLNDPVLNNAYRCEASSLVITEQAVGSVDDPGGVSSWSPGETPRSANATKRRSVNRTSDEYQVKRERNNIAVRKSRNKTKMRVQETEQRVKELEGENSLLLNKIAMLNKELNVLKNLFTSAGVAQPARVPAVKEEFTAEL